jgi:peptidyl-prolyl cis-trans isomerase D
MAFLVSKRLVDAEISQLPGTKGLNGEFSEQAYRQFLSQQQLTDATVRELVSANLLPTAHANTGRNRRSHSRRISRRPYASMLMEAREGDAAIVPVTAFSAGLKPTDADLQAFYSANRARYMIPEQRVLRIARLGPAQVAGIVPSDQRSRLITIPTRHSSRRRKRAA